MPLPDDTRADQPPQRWPVLCWLQRLFAPLRKDDTAGLDDDLRRDIGLPRRHAPVDIAALLDRAKFDGRRE